MIKQTGRLSKTIVIISFAYILYKTLYPFQFAFKETFSTLEFNFFLLSVTRFLAEDTLLNVLLFIPLGFSLTSYLIKKERASRLPTFYVVLIVSAGLSYAIEMLQIFQPLRVPTLNDFYANSGGGMIGYLFARWIQQSLSGYVALLFIISIPLQMQTTLSTWDMTFPLLLGNEPTGDRQWEGSLSELYITDRALSKAEIGHAYSNELRDQSISNSLLASYQLSGKGNYHDSAGLLPDLVWIGKPASHDHDKGVSVGRRHWLESLTPAVPLTQRIIETSQFTLSVKVAAHKTVQTGPARIVSLSRDPYKRNFTLGQHGGDLVFRIRTPLIGNNGIPGVIVKDVFATKDLRHLLISYDGSVLKIYVDGVNNVHTFELSPGAAAFSYFYSLNMADLRGYKVLWYAILFIPLGILLSLNKTIRKRTGVLIIGGIVIPSLFLEFVLVSVSGRDIIMENLLLGILFTAGPVVISIFIRSFHVSKEPVD
jgi:glycopeptide antibiotics resistance protein